MRPSFAVGPVHRVGCIIRPLPVNEMSCRIFALARGCGLKSGAAGSLGHGVNCVEFAVALSTLAAKDGS